MSAWSDPVRKRAAAGALLLAALVAAALFRVQWTGTDRPHSAARPPEQGRGQQTSPPDQNRQQTGTASPPPGPAAQKSVEQQRAIPGPEQKRSPGARAEFAHPEATPRGLASPPAGRSGTAPGLRLQVQPTAPQLADYFRAVSAKVADRWSLPKTVKRRDATIPIVLKIARDGRVLWAVIEGSSGDPAIDDSVAKMIEDIRREGLPPLPDQYPYDELDIGLTLNSAGVS